jgi:hypothetical protein
MKYVVKIKGSKLQIMRDNDMKLYGTPGALEPYWAQYPKYSLDEVIASTYDFTDEIDGRRNYTLEVDIPEHDSEIADVFLPL